MKKINLLSLLVLVLFGCNNDKPKTTTVRVDTVRITTTVQPTPVAQDTADINDVSPDNWVLSNGKDPLIIYKKLLMNHQELGRWNYWVTNGRGAGNWRLVSNANYNVGDTLRISKK